MRIIAGVGATIALMAVSMGGESQPARNPITIEATSFQPKSITVKAGDTVTWTNKDPFPHTATSQAAGFDSHAIPPGKSWTYTVTKRGEFTYVCTLHPTMTATLKVE